MEWEEPAEDDADDDALGYDPYHGMRSSLRRLHMEMDQTMFLMLAKIGNPNESRKRKDLLVSEMRRKVEEMAAKGVEQYAFWSVLASVSRGADRLDALTRALICLEKRMVTPMSASCPAWTFEAWTAECLYKIAAHHAKDADPVLARDFLIRAEKSLDDSDRHLAEEGEEPDKFLRKKMDRLWKKLGRRG